MKIFFYFLTFYLVSVQLFSQVSVSIIDFRVNNMAVTNNQINFNNASSVNLKFTVKLSTTNGNANNILGNLFIYSKEVLTSDTFVQRDFRAVTFIENNPPFVPETIYTSEYNIEIDLSRSQFYNTGGILYAVYRNSSNNNFFSGNIDIIGGSSINTSPNLLSNSICCNQTIRYGDKPSLITASYIDPDSTFDKKWINVVPGDLPFQNASTNFAVDKVNSYDPGFLFETKTYLRRLGTTGSNFVANQSNQITITVVPTPIISNNISTNAINIENNIHEINEGQILDFYGTVSKVNLNVLNNPFHIPVRGDDIDFVQFYFWQIFDGLNWSNISNSNSTNLNSFSLPINFISPKNFKVRRVAHYQGISRVSNEIEIRIRSTHSNSICCSQILTSNNGVFTQPTILIGSIPTFNYSVIPTNYSLISFTISYQWQRQIRTSPWSNILGATNKDYLPISETYNYRRIAKVDYQIRRNSTNLNQTYSTFSNTVEVEKRVRGNTASKSNDIGKSEIFIYPNPVNDIMYIKGVDTTEMLNFRLFDLLGKEYFANYINDSKSDEGYFDFSGLSVGIYFLHLTNNSNELIIKKIIKSN